MACQLVARGLKVYVLDKAPPEFDQVTYITCDVGNKTEYESRLKAILTECDTNRQPVSVFINNVGIRHHQPLLNMKDHEILDHYNINVLSYIWGVRLVLAHHMTCPTNPLSLVTVSSVLGTLAPKNLTIYSSTKAALSQIHDGLLQELMDFPSIRPLLVVPGQLLRGMFDDIKPSRVFFAPIVDCRILAEEIVERIEVGEVGVLCRPMYGRFLYVVKSLPFVGVRVCRWYSEMDRKVHPQPSQTQLAEAGLTKGSPTS